jgi:hypothetical protein
MSPRSPRCHAFGDDTWQLLRKLILRSQCQWLILVNDDEWLMSWLNKMMVNDGYIEIHSGYDSHFAMGFSMAYS